MLISKYDILRLRTSSSVLGVEKESVTVTVTLKSPVAVVVPEITPAVEQLKPAGNPVAPQVSGGLPPVAARVAL